MTRSRACFSILLGFALLGATRPRTTADVIRDAEIASDDFSGDSRALEVSHGELVEVIAEEPKNAMAHYALGRIETLLACPGSRNCDPEKAKEAMALIDRALVLDPKLAEAHVGRGWLFQYQADTWGAEEEARLALQLRPGFWRALYLQARIALGQKQFEKAIQAASSIVRRNEEPRILSRAHFVLSMAYTDTRQLPLADSSYRAAIQFAPTSAWYKGNYADYLLWVNKVDEAIAMAKAALAQVNYPGARDTLRRAYRAKSALLSKKSDTRGADKFTKLADALE